ncbi:MAG: hypothetical protein KGL10_06070 [Alphaproteobacteria bacterium]|nr:hypothetical protein [Alphaproteobacteria bacterium]
MAFDYKTTGLPDKAEWRAAAETCHAWLTENMKMFGPERIASFMAHQPVTAARLIMEKCDDWSEESVTLALLGPAKEALLDKDSGFGVRAKELFEAMAEKREPDAAMRRDLVRLFLVEGLSTMNDQMIGRKKIDGFHQKRWQILRGLESGFAAVKGQNPALDAIFEKAMKESRATLEGLDKGGKGSAPRHLEP